MLNVRTFTNWRFFVYFKPTRVRTYVNLRWGISLNEPSFVCTLFSKLMIPPIKWFDSFEFKISIPGNCSFNCEYSINLFSNSKECQTTIYVTMSSIFLTMCIYCQQSVRPRQEGLQCDGCLRWQHRTCNTCVSQSEYRDAVKTGASIDWRCLTCHIPLAESTALSKISVSVDPDVHFNSEQNSDQGNYFLSNFTQLSEIIEWLNFSDLN